MTTVSARRSDIRPTHWTLRRAAARVCTWSSGSAGSSCRNRSRSAAGQLPQHLDLGLCHPLRVAERTGAVIEHLHERLRHVANFVLAAHPEPKIPVFGAPESLVEAAGMLEHGARE